MVMGDTLAGCRYGELQAHPHRLDSRAMGINA